MAKLCEHRYQITPHVIPYGIDSEFWGEKIKTNRADYQLKEKDFVIIAPSMVTPCKKQSEILDTLMTLQKVIPDIKVIFAGYKDDNNNYTKQLFQFISDNSLKENVMFTGMINREQLRNFYNLADAAVFAGSGQGSWLGGFEALATGTPIIVSPQLTCSELVKRENLGIVSDNLVESIKEIYNHREDYQKQARQQKEYVRQNLTWDNFCKTMTEYMRIKLENI
jgi:1,2-diacylglycerol 3-alpha-glucosyltransferase